MEAAQEDLVEVEGIGPDRAELIAEWFEDEENRALIEELRGLGLRFEAGDEAKPVEGPLTGNTYVITGTLEGFTRDEAGAALEALGAKIANSVSSKTTAVIAGESPGSKLQKAQKAGVEVLDESGAREATSRRRLAPERSGPPPASRTRRRAGTRCAGSRRRSVPSRSR